MLSSQAWWSCVNPFPPCKLFEGLVEYSKCIFHNGPSSFMLTIVEVLKDGPITFSMWNHFPWQERITPFPQFGKRGCHQLTLLMLDWKSFIYYALAYNVDFHKTLTSLTFHGISTTKWILNCFLLLTIAWTIMELPPPPPHFMEEIISYKNTCRF
jgi:hypothetical protein